MADLEQLIRERAFQLWEQAGRPEGRSDEFWHTARQEMEGDVPPLGDKPGGAVDFPPDARSVEDPPEAEAAVPGASLQEHGAIDPDVASIAVPDVRPSEPEAAEATVPAPARARTRSAPSVSTSAARKAADADEDAAADRRPRTGATRPPTQRPR